MLRHLSALCLTALLLGPIAVPDAHSATAPKSPRKLCRARHAGEKCKPGDGRRAPECATCVSHAQWPRITGVRWQVVANSLVRHHFVGGPANDELLGRHGSDSIAGEDGDDVLWGDAQHVGNRGGQRDDLRGGPGDDWIYASHGFNRISGGSGDDRVVLFYGRGTVDCGSGQDTVRIGGAAHHYKLRHCERVLR